MNIPLLDTDYAKEMACLQIDYKSFMSDIDNFNKELESNQKATKFSTLGLSLQKMKTDIENVNMRINYIKNSWKDEVTTTNKGKEMVETIKKVSLEMNNRFETLNKQFIQAINVEKTHLNDTTETTSDNSTEYALQQGQEQTQIPRATQKTRFDADRLKERKEELESVAKVTNQILLLSRDMKNSASHQTTIVSNLEDNIIVSRDHLKGANDELNKRGDTSDVNLRRYFWLALILLIIVIIGVAFIYLYYYKRE